MNLKQNTSLPQYEIHDLLLTENPEQEHDLTLAEEPGKFLKTVNP